MPTLWLHERGLHPARKGWIMFVFKINEIIKDNVCSLALNGWKQTIVGSGFRHYHTMQLHFHSILVQTNKYFILLFGKDNSHGRGWRRQLSVSSSIYSAYKLLPHTFIHTLLHFFEECQLITCLSLFYTLLTIPNSNKVAFNWEIFQGFVFDLEIGKNKFVPY